MFASISFTWVAVGISPIEVSCGGSSNLLQSASSLSRSFLTFFILSFFSYVLVVKITSISTHIYIQLWFYDSQQSHNWFTLDLFANVNIIIYTYNWTLIVDHEFFTTAPYFNVNICVTFTRDKNTFTLQKCTINRVCRFTDISARSWRDPIQITWQKLTVHK